MRNAWLRAEATFSSLHNRYGEVTQREINHPNQREPGPEILMFFVTRQISRATTPTAKLFNCGITEALWLCVDAVEFYRDPAMPMLPPRAPLLACAY